MNAPVAALRRRREWRSPGDPPRQFSIEQPTKLELVISLETAKALGLTIPQSVLLRAGRSDSVTAVPGRDTVTVGVRRLSVSQDGFVPLSGGTPRERPEP